MGGTTRSAAIPRWLATSAFVITAVAVAGAGVAEDPADTIVEPSPAASTAPLASERRSENGFARARSIAIWNGHWLARGEGPPQLIDPAQRTTRAIAIAGESEVIDVGMQGERLIALVHPVDRPRPSLVIAEPGADGDSPRWQEHVLPEDLSPDRHAPLRLWGSTHGVAVWGGERAYFLSDDAWHQAPTRHLAEQRPRDVRFVRDRWFVQYFGARCLAGSESTLLSMDARGGDVRLEPRPKPVGVLADAWHLVVDARGDVWTAGDAEGSAFVRADGRLAPLSLGTDMATPAEAEGEARANARMWRFGPNVLLRGLGFDDDNRPLFADQHRGVLRRDRDGGWTWLTPGWPTKQTIVWARPVGGSIVVLAEDDTIGVIAAGGTPLTWLAPPSGPPVAFGPTRIAPGAITHAVVRHPRPPRAFPYLPADPASLESPPRGGPSRQKRRVAEAVKRQTWTADFEAE